MRTGILLIAVTFSLVLLPACNSALPTTPTPETQSPLTAENQTSSNIEPQVTDLHYFPEEPEFICNILGYDTGGSTANRITFSGIYTSFDTATPDGDWNAYHFEEATQGEIFVLLPASVKDKTLFTPGIEYSISYERQVGWPTVYGMIISEEADLVFAGITDWEINGIIDIDDEIFPALNQPIFVKQARVLADNYWESRWKNSVYRKTNTEITFSLNGESVTLHQGEPAILGAYYVKLLVARTTSWVNGPTDAGQNGISYIITRTD